MWRRMSVMRPKTWPRIARGCETLLAVARRSLPGSTRCMAPTWSTSICASRSGADHRRRVGHARAPAASAWSWWRTACPCCSPAVTARASPRRTRAGAGSRPACSNRPCARWACRGDELTAWLGPAISQEHFEVGDEVREAFVDADRGRGRCIRARMRAAAGRRISSGLRAGGWRALGVTDVQWREWCTFADRERFYSHRRDGKGGRMAALIWREAHLAVRARGA